METKKYKTAKGRVIHGAKGEGRFCAFALGPEVDWFFANGKDQFVISGNFNSLTSFEISFPEPTQKEGCEVTIHKVQKDFPILYDNVKDYIINHFALKLYRDLNFRIIYDGKPIDVKSAVKFVDSYELEIYSTSNDLIKVKLEIIEWNIKVEKKLFICNENGIVINEKKPTIHAKGFEYTAYLSSSFLNDYNEKLKGLENFNKDYDKLMKEVRNKLRDHFKERISQEAITEIDSWKKQGIYPYHNDPQNYVERSSQHLFNAVALEFSDFSDSFSELSLNQRKLIFGLLKSTIESNSLELLPILQNIVNLPKEKQNQLTYLLKKTNMSHIINAARAVTNRLEFLKGLQHIIFDKNSKELLKERSQLHKIIVNETWIFGEEYNLVINDQDLTTVLKQHLKLLKNKNEEIEIDLLETPVRDSDGKKAIIDLMLSCRVPLPRGEQRKHLVVELKRPSQLIDINGIEQIKNYADAVIYDPRFNSTEVEWEFIIISTDISERAQREATQANRPKGLVYEYGMPKIRVWVKTWGQLISEAEGRLKFFKEQLNFEAKNSDGLDYLSRINLNFLDDHTKQRIEEHEKENALEDC